MSKNNFFVEHVRWLLLEICIINETKGQTVLQQLSITITSEEILIPKKRDD